MIDQPPGAAGIAETAAELEGTAAADVLDTEAAGGILIRGGALRIISYVAVVGLSVLSAALLTRHLGVSRFGQYTTVLSLVSIVAVITDAGMSNIGTREYAVSDGAERDSLMRELLGLRVVLTLVGVAIAVLFAFAAGYDSALLVGTALAGLGTVAVVLQHTLSIPLTTQLRLGTLATLDFARQLASVVAIVALVALGAGVLPLLAVQLLAGLLMIPATGILVRGAISLRPSLHPKAWGELLRLTVAFSLATAIGTLYVYTAQILTSLVSTHHQSGLFAASFRVFIVITGIPGLVVSGALPVLARAARDDRTRLGYALQRIFDVSLITGVAATLGAVAGSHFIIQVVGGSAYAAASTVLRIQAVALLASFLLAGWAFALLSLRLHRGMLIANAAAFAVSTTLTLILASASGARGAALATVGGETTLAVGYLLALLRRHPEYRPRSRSLLTAAVCAAPSTAIALLAPVPSVVDAVLAVGLYGVLILISGALPAELAVIMPSALRRFARG